MSAGVLAWLDNIVGHREVQARHDLERAAKVKDAPAIADAAEKSARMLANAREARATVATVFAKAQIAADRLWQSDNADDRTAGDELIAALARAAGGQS